MPKLTVDGKEVEVPAGFTVLQACEAAGVEIPRFCYHERLSIAGNCRMCLVELEKAPKPIASCAMPAADGMVIKTTTETVHKARKGVMEFLLINHPLDCPICDQGGECDLQDQAMAYGMDHGRYKENKRAVPEKNFGPLIKTAMTRCIHCTRCVRFATEIAGVEELGAVGRGERMEITPYLERALASELSANVIDLCPVGALTSKPYAFVARPWELRNTNSIDVTDAVGSAIRIDTRGRDVMRILPRINEAVNEEWISDKTRYVHDGLKRQRLDRPYVRRDGKLTPATWAEALSFTAEKLQSLDAKKIAAIAGDLCDVESVYALRHLMDRLGSPHRDCRQDGAKIDPVVRAGYVFNSTIAGIEQADICLMIGTNPRWEAPLINARLRKRYLMNGFRVGVIGEAYDLTYKTEYLGAGADTLRELAEGRHPFAEAMKNAQRPMLIIGQGALTGADGTAVLALARQVADQFGLIREGWNGFNMLHTAAGRVGALDAGFVPGAGGRDVAAILDGAQSGEIAAVYLLGADEIDMDKLGRAFVIYQGHHGDAGAHRADVIFPGAAYTEKDALYVNTEGRVQYAYGAIFPPGEARADWAIVRALSDALGHGLPFDTLDALRNHLSDEIPLFRRVGDPAVNSWGSFGTKGTVGTSPFRSPIRNFYMTDPISRASEVMAQCTHVFGGTPESRTGTGGR